MDCVVVLEEFLNIVYNIELNDEFQSQHEDMESEFGRLQNEKLKEEEDHKKQEDEREIEYNQFKQEKMLEISSLKGKTGAFNVSNVFNSWFY